jgi:hypothetical protein
MGLAGQRFENAKGGVVRAWMALAKETAPLTLGPMTDVLDGMTAAIPKLEPLIRDVAPTMARVGRDLKNWLSGDGFERFINALRISGVPAFRSLVAAGRDTVATLGRGFRDFLPLAQNMAEDIEAGAAKMRRWADGGGFDRFISSWRQTAPAGNKALREVGESFRIIGTLLNDVGPGQLQGINTFLDILNKIDPKALTKGIIAFATGAGLLRGLFVLMSFIAMVQSGRVEITASAALAAAAAALSGAGGPLLAMAAALTRLADNLRNMRPNTGKLDEIKRIWDSIPKNGSASFNLNSPATVQLMGIGSTWAAVSGRSQAFNARAEIGAFTGPVAGIVIIWTAVRIIGSIPPIFRALAIPGNVPAVAGMILALWGVVRTMASIPAIFTATANGGAVNSAAAAIIAAWARVRALATVMPVFIAIAIGGPAIAGSIAVAAAWMRVMAMPRSWSATARVNPGPAVAGSSRVAAAWRALYGMPRSWSAVASVSVSGGFGGLGGGGAVTVNINKPFVTFQPATIGPGRLPNIPDFPGLDDFSPTSGGAGGTVSGGNFDPGDFAGGFENATGGPIGREAAEARARNLGGPSDRHLHIWDDVWIQSSQDLVGLISEAMENAH